MRDFEIEIIAEYFVDDIFFTVDFIDFICRS